MYVDMLSAEMYGIKKLYHGSCIYDRFSISHSGKKLTDQNFKTTPTLIPLSRADLSLSKFKQLLRKPTFGTGEQFLLNLRLRHKYILNICCTYNVSSQARLDTALKCTQVLYIVP
jgi:hypothetical protein